MSDDEEGRGVLRNRNRENAYADDQEFEVEYSTQAEIQKDNQANMFVRKFISKFDTDKFTNSSNFKMSSRVKRRRMGKDESESDQCIDE